MKEPVQGKGERLVTVIVDGNNHNLMHNGKPVGIKTKITDNIVTLEKCQEVAENIRKMGHEPKKLFFMLKIFTETPGNDCGDFPEECLLNKDAYYYVESNCLRIWEYGMPVYQNCGGDICTDEVALADCLL